MKLIPLLLMLLVLPPLAWAKARPVATESGIVFCKGADYELKLDLARPLDGEGPFPALVFLCGNGWGWYGGDRRQYVMTIGKAAERGYVAITIDYRSTSDKVNGRTKYPFPVQLYDAKSAVRWLRANAGKYRIDPERIGAVGWSSGGHLALLLGMTDPSDGLEGDGGNLEFSSRVQAVVNSAGAKDLASLYGNTDAPGRIQALLGGTPEELPDLYRAASPLSYVRRENPPILTLQGDKDVAMPLIQSENFDAKMREAGADHTLIIKKGVGHRDFNGDSAVWDFLDAHLKGGG